MRRIARTGATLALWLRCSAVASADDSIVLVSNVALPEGALEASHVKGVFLGTRSTLPGGLSVVPITQGSTAAATALFFETVMRLPMADYERSWQERQLSGQGMTPLAVESTAAAVALVAVTPGSVTYALSSEVMPPGVFVTPIVVKTHK